jgi:hypothetical protein
VDEMQQNEECSINVKNDLEDIPACFITPTSKKIKWTKMVDDVLGYHWNFFQSVKYLLLKKLKIPVWHFK